MKSQRKPYRSMGRLAAVVACVAMVAGACDNKKDDAAPASSASASSAASSSAPVDSAPVTTTATSDSAPADSTPSSEPAAEIKTGGTLKVSGEAEVSNAWLPSAMQCDSYCYQRAFTFFDPIMALGTDGKIHPILAESMTPNADFTQWTIKVRSGINFTDGTPLNADAMIRNIQETGNGLLVSAAIKDLARIPDPADATKQILKIEKADDMTFTIFTGEGGDPAKPISWKGFPAYLTQQLGLVASPTWLDAVKADKTKASMPVGTGPFIVESFAPRDKLVVKRNPNYWMKDKDGKQLPYLDSIEFRVIEDSEVAAPALESGDIDIFATSQASVIRDFVDKGTKFTTIVQEKYGETNFILLDQAKPPMDDQRVRCALSKAIDRSEIIESIYGDFLEPATGVFSPGREGYLADNGFSADQDMDGAKKLIAEYEADKGPVSVKLGTTATTANAQLRELLKGYWDELGVTTEEVQVPQDSFITDALFGKEQFQMYVWRQYAGTGVDPLNFWWNSRGYAPDGELSLNFPRMQDPKVDELLRTIRTTTSDADRIAASEELNRHFAEQCYFIPTSYTKWGIPMKTTVKGYGTATAPDGTTLLDGGNFPGQYFTTTMWIDG